MRKKEKVNEILRLLDEYYPTQDKCYLDYQTDWQLMIATILSAQCTDDRVNMVTPGLFLKYARIEDFAGASLSELERDIHSTGFYRHKAKNIIGACQMLLIEYGGKMPHDIDELTRLPGVGRKTANVIRSHVFNLPSIVVDTHVKRISNKLGLTANQDPEKIEYDLMKLLPQEHWIRYNTQIIAHGRKICKARRPDCGACFLAEECESNEKG